jgi:hypothetical protein
MDDGDLKPRQRLGSHDQTVIFLVSAGFDRCLFDGRNRHPGLL